MCNVCNGYPNCPVCSPETEHKEIEFYVEIYNEESEIVNEFTDTLETSEGYETQDINEYLVMLEKKYQNAPVITYDGEEYFL